MSSREAVKSLRTFLEIVRRSGKVSYGMRSSMKYVRPAKVIIVSNSATSSELERIRELASKSRTPVIMYNVTSAELGRIAGRPHPVKALVVNTLGDADLNKLLSSAKDAEESGATKILVQPRGR